MANETLKCMLTFEVMKQRLFTNILPADEVQIDCIILEREEVVKRKALLYLLEFRLMAACD